PRFGAIMPLGEGRDERGDDQRDGLHSAASFSEIEVAVFEQGRAESIAECEYDADCRQPRSGKLIEQTDGRAPESEECQRDPIVQWMPARKRLTEPNDSCGRERCDADIRIREAHQQAEKDECKTEKRFAAVQLRALLQFQSAAFRK